MCVCACAHAYVGVCMWVQVPTVAGGVRSLGAATGWSLSQVLQKSFALHLNSWGNSPVLVVLLLQWYIMLCLYCNIVCTHVCALSIKSKTAGMLLQSLFVLLNVSWCKDSTYHLPPQQSILVWPMPFWSWLFLLLLIKTTAIYLMICEYIFDFIFQRIRKLLTLCINMNVKNLVSWSKNLEQRYGSSGEVCYYLRR